MISIYVYFDIVIILFYILLSFCIMALYFRFENASAEYLSILHSLSESMSPLKKNKHIEEINSPEKPNSNAENNSNNQLIKTDINSTKPVVDVHLHTFLINQVSCMLH